MAGIGQGNGAGLHIWVAVSTPLFKIMQLEGLVALFICALSKAQRAMAGLAFINDTDLIINATSNAVTDVEIKMQHLLTMWHGLLCATRGELVPEKCFWYLINFEWNNQQWKYKKSQATLQQLSIQQPNSGRIIIP